MQRSLLACSTVAQAFAASRATEYTKLGCYFQLPFLRRAVATLVLNSGGCKPVTSFTVTIRAGQLLNLLRESRNTRSMLAFNAKYSSTELQAASTLSSAVTPYRGAKASSRRPLQQKGWPHLPPSIGHAALEPHATFPPQYRIR